MKDLVAFVRRELGALADPEKAGPMAAYMKTTMPFYGVQKTQRAPVMRQMVKQFPITSQAQYEDAVLSVWKLPHREERYAAIHLARAHSRFIAPPSLPLYERLVREGAWWDLVDDVAIHLVGKVWLGHRTHTERVMDRWINDPDLWIRRTAILGQNKHRAATDEGRLFRYCEARAEEKEFFIRKAIGWALREYAYEKPAAVRGFLRRMAGRLSGLSVREAAKHL